MRHWTTLVLALLAAVAALTPAAPLAAQGAIYDVLPVSQYETGCLEPSPCDCLPVPVGPLSGSFRLVPVPFSLGPIFEFTIVDFTVMVTPDTAAPFPVTASGLYTIDLASDVQWMSLDAEVGGIATSFASFPGFVPVEVGFPDQIEIDVFEPVACILDGMRLQAVRRAEFRRGDANGDGSFDLADAIAVLEHLFAPSPTAPVLCIDAADANDDGLANIADPIAILAALFAGGALPPAPFPGCGLDPTADPLGCAAYAACL